MQKKLIKQEAQELKKAVFQAQHESGLQALLQLAAINRDMALNAWRQAQGADLTRFQAAYNTYQTVIDLVTKQPVEFESGE